MTTSDRSRPELDDTTVEALGKLSEALETLDQARGQLYGFHQHTGKADLLLQDAVELLRKAGHAQLADDLDRDLVGRNVIADRWTCGDLVGGSGCRRAREGGTLRP